MLRVLHCIYDDPANPWVAGGGAVRAREIYRRLRGDVAVRVVTGRYPGSRDGTVDGVRYERVGVARPYAASRLSYAVEAARLLRRGDYDVAVYDFSVYAPILVPLAPAPVGLVVHHLTGPSARARWGRPLGAALDALERRLLRRGRWISTPSRWTAQQVRAVVGPDATIRAVGAGVDDAFFDVDRSDAGYLLYFGRLDLFQKGLDTLLRAFARLLAARPELELRIAGRGKDEARVAKLARGLGVDAAVKLLGGVDDAGRLALFAGATLLVMPSRFEGFGLVAAEALAAGVPVVAAAAGALPEVVGSAGACVAPDDEEALAAALEALLADPERLRTLGAEARAWARQYAWDDVARRHLAFLEEIAEAAGTRPLGGGE